MKKIKYIMAGVALLLCAIVYAQGLPSWVSANTRTEIQRAQQQQRMLQQQRVQQQYRPMVPSTTTQALINSYRTRPHIPSAANPNYSINNSSVGGVTYNFAGATDTRGVSSSSVQSRPQQNTQQRQRTAVRCTNCNGTGVCPHCGGRGYRQVGVSTNYIKCHCGNGRCTVCGGTGVSGYVYR